MQDLLIVGTSSWTQNHDSSWTQLHVVAGHSMCVTVLFCPWSDRRAIFPCFVIYWLLFYLNWRICSLCGRFLFSKVIPNSMGEKDSQKRVISLAIWTLDENFTKYRLSIAKICMSLSIPSWKKKSRSRLNINFSGPKFREADRPGVTFSYWSILNSRSEH